MRGEIGPVGALFVVVAFVLGFGALAGEVVEGDTTAFDRHILLLFRDADDPGRLLGPPWFQEMARDQKGPETRWRCGPACSPTRRTSTSSWTIIQTTRRSCSHRPAPDT